MVNMKCPICNAKINNLDNVCDVCGWTKSDDTDYNPECSVCVIDEE